MSTMYKMLIKDKPTCIIRILHLNVLVNFAYSFKFLSFFHIFLYICLSLDQM